MKYKPIIETERLIIREYTQDDFDDLYEILSDKETMKYYPKPRDKEGVQRWLDWSFKSYKKDGFGLWAINLKDTGEFVGDCGITMQNIDGESLPEIGYHINKKYWRKGYGKEAARACRDWFFKNYFYDAVYSYMNSDNVPSYSLAEANGMKRIKEYFDPKESQNTYVYAITRSEWKKLLNV